MDIRKLMLDEKESQVEEYKSGWNDAVCWVNENFKIQDKKNKEINVVFELDLEEDKIIEAIKGKHE